MITAMLVEFESILFLNTPLWLSLCLAAALLFMVWRQHAMARQLRQHSRSIGNMDAWADATDERLDRVDWSRQRRIEVSEQRNSWRRAG